MSVQFQSQGVALAILFTLYVMAIAVITGVAIKQQGANENSASLSIAPPPFIKTAQPNFSSISDIPKRKNAFFSFFRPMIQMQNLHIEREREALTKIEYSAEQGSLTEREQKVLNELKDKYKVETEDQQETIALLKRRINIIPESMVLAQAASESAWGTSRFATKANNFFGEWCFKAGCGLVPKRRPEGAIHEVATFDTPLESVRSYFLNINTHPAYKDLRTLRQELEEKGEFITGSKLVAGLERYSERGHEYIGELRSIIRFNKLESGTQISGLDSE